jgi:hypothetical protein
VLFAYLDVFARTTDFVPVGKVIRIRDPRDYAGDPLDMETGVGTPRFPVTAECR